MVKLKKIIGKFLKRQNVFDGQRVFIIGRNKTGTTSIKRAFEDLNFQLGNQRDAEKLMPYYKNEDFDAIVQYCKTAQVFQDFPFSYPETFKHLDKAFPNSKFILTVRDNAEQWYNSLINFHAKRFGKGKTPSKDDLQNAEYVWRGWMWECNRLMYGTPENDPYNREQVIQSYLDYNESVKLYFRNRPNDLIIINLNEKGAYQKLMNFLNIESPYSDFPWENKTDLIKTKK